MVVNEWTEHSQGTNLWFMYINIKIISHSQFF